MPSSNQKKHSQKNPCDKKQRLPNLAGKWTLIGRQIQYRQAPDGTIISPDLCNPDILNMPVTIEQCGEFFGLTLVGTGELPRLGGITRDRGQWQMTYTSSKCNGTGGGHFKELNPSKIKIAFYYTGFSCPTAGPDPQPCNPFQVPGIFIGKLVRVCDPWDF